MMYSLVGDEKGSQKNIHLLFDYSPFLMHECWWTLDNFPLTRHCWGRCFWTRDAQHFSIPLFGCCGWARRMGHVFSVGCLSCWEGYWECCSTVLIFVFSWRANCMRGRCKRQERVVCCRQQKRCVAKPGAIEDWAPVNRIHKYMKLQKGVRQSFYNAEFINFLNGT